MSAYRPKPSKGIDSDYEYIYSTPVRFGASLVMVVGSATPALLVTYAAISGISTLWDALPVQISRSIAMFFVAATFANILKYGAEPDRPSVANGCIPDDHTAPRKRVAVIGAGITGLMSAKELKAEGHDVVIYEASSMIGGAWAAGGELGRGRVWSHTVSSTSAVNSGISDFPLDSYFPADEAPYHLTQERFQSYIESYADAFGLRPLIQFHQPVTQVSQTISPGGEGWAVTSKPLDQPAPVVEYFDFLAVCTGQVQTPKIPTIAGQEKFQGDIVHISSVSDAEKFKGKNVVCVGNGETGSDITEVVAESADSCYLSVRNPFVCLPRNFFGVPPDFYESRSLYVCPFWVRWLILKPQICFTIVLKYWDRRARDGRTIRPSPDWWKLQNVLLNFKYFKSVLAGERTPCSSLLVTKSERFLYAVDSGACKLKPGLESLDATGAQFEDGSDAKCDTVLLFTGYKQGVFPMFGGDHHLSHSQTKSRYLLTFDPDVGSSVAFLGFCRGQAGSLIIPAEMQARWFSLIVSGKRRLPRPKEMRAEIEAQRIGDKGYAATLGGWFIANYIARYHVGCEPSGVRLFLTQGPLVAWRVFTQSFAAYMYRFEGPHAKPDLARRVYYETVATCGKPSAWHFLEVFTMSLGAVFDVVSQIPGIGRKRALRPLMDMWW